MKIAITGGSGFVGRHLARELVGGGHEVVLVARGADRRDLTVAHTVRGSIAKSAHRRTPPCM